MDDGPKATSGGHAAMPDSHAAASARKRVGVGGATGKGGEEAVEIGREEAPPIGGAGGAGPARENAREEDRASGRRRLIFQAIRLLITAGLILWIALSVDWGEFWHTVLATDFFYLGLSLAISPVLALVSVWKWKILLRALSFRVGLGTCFQFYLVGVFFNNFLPTHVGGDVVRGFLLGRKLGGTASVMASVVAERVTGLVTLLVAALLVIGYDRGRIFSGFVIWGVLGAVAIISLAVWLMLDRRVLGLVRRKAHLPFVDKLARFQEALQEYRDRRRAVAACLALSLLFYFLAAVNVYLTARAFHAPIGLGHAVLAAPIVMVIMLIPISMGGIGLSEWAYMFVLGKFDVSSAAGLSTALLLRVKSVLMGLAGGLAYMVRFEVPFRSLPALSRGAGPDAELAPPGEAGTPGTS